ncbi:MAG: hypothetical protein VX675_05295 [Planctomycetota bacterium]|nr:hypothetical protein [Planctomycetota bacterium]
MRQASARSIGFQQGLRVFFLPAITSLFFGLFFSAPAGLGALEVKRGDEPAGVKLGGVEWQGIEKGLADVRQRYKPALVWYSGSSGKDDLGLLKRLENSAFRRLVEKYILIRLTPADLKKAYSPKPGGPRTRKAGKRRPALKPLPAAADGPTVSAELRLPPGDPALVVLDFRERLIERYDRELPGKDTLSSRLKRILKISDYYARQSIPFEKLLLESKEALKLGNKRIAVLKVRDLESPSLRKRMDPVLQSWVATLIRDYRQAARKALEKAIALEKEGDKLKSDSGLKYTKAIDAFEKVSKDYPFKDIMVEANRHSGDILRKMTAFGNNPFPR